MADATTGIRRASSEKSPTLASNRYSKPEYRGLTESGTVAGTPMPQWHARPGTPAKRPRESRRSEVMHRAAPNPVAQYRSGTATTMDRQAKQDTPAGLTPMPILPCSRLVAISNAVQASGGGAGPALWQQATMSTLCVIAIRSNDSFSGLVRGSPAAPGITEQE